MRFTTRFAAIAAATTMLGMTGAAAQAHHARNASKAAYDIPAVLQSQHAYIDSELKNAAKLTGPVGAAARDVAKLLEAHVAREQRLALPPLALLKPLSEGDFDPEMVKLLPLTNELFEVMPTFLSEHARIVEATKRLKEAACANGNTRVDALADHLIQHTQMEEEVIYPAALNAAPLVRIMGRSKGLSI